MRSTNILPLSLQLLQLGILCRGNTLVILDVDLFENQLGTERGKGRCLRGSQILGGKHSIFLLQFVLPTFQSVDVSLDFVDLLFQELLLPQLRASHVLGIPL